MRDYKRITERNYNFVCMDCDKCELKRDCNNNKCFVRAKYRLAELEDKIERGELFSIPFIRKHPKVDNAYMVVYESEHGDLLGQMFCSENAKEEAEKFLEQKLKDLKGEV